MKINVPAGLFEKAYAVMQHAYVPFLNYQVGCSVLTTDGRVFTGCNVQNSSFPLGVCAEAGAISQMIAGGAKRIAAILVIANHETPCTPCGGCRQIIREFASGDVPVYCANQHEVVRVHTVDELLPFSFGPEHMGTNE